MSDIASSSKLSKPLWSDAEVDGEESNVNSDTSFQMVVSKNDVKKIQQNWVNSFINKFDEDQNEFVLIQVLKLSDRYVKLIQRNRIISPEYKLIVSEAHGDNINLMDFMSFKQNLIIILSNNIFQKSNIRDVYSQLITEFLTESSTIERPFYRLDVFSSMISPSSSGAMENKGNRVWVDKTQIVSENPDSLIKLISAYRTIKLDKKTCSEISIYFKMIGMMSESELWSSKSNT
jgi:hypothetical protein